MGNHDMGNPDMGNRTARGRIRAAMIAVCLALGLAGCASGGSPGFTFTDFNEADAVNRIRIFVATTREPDTETVIYSGERGRKAGFATLDISVPRQHVPGELELPAAGGAVVPSQHFAVVKGERVDLGAIKAGVKAAIAKRPPGERDVLVFVHGFNTTFADAAFRFAQIIHDSGFKGVPVLFTWPSRGRLLAYPYDRDSVMYSRDVLEQGLRSIATELGASRIDLLAHSMGTLLTLETLRQASIRGDGSFGGKLREVMLASPDVDLDVFQTQIRAINRPLTVFVSRDDKALAFSRRFAGDKRRLGALSEQDVETIADLKRSGVEIIDLSSVSTSDGLNHAKFASSPKVVRLIGTRLANDKGIALRGEGLGGAVSGVIGAVGNTVEAVVNAPVAILTNGQGPQLDLSQP
jgi:esterase/lipase superfamily enzyme